jgi:hypothetical protein
MKKKERKRDERHENEKGRRDFEDDQEARQECLKAVPGTSRSGFSGAENDRGN